MDKVCSPGGGGLGGISDSHLPQPATSVGSAALVPTWTWPLSCSVTLSRSLNLSKPQSPHLWNGDTDLVGAGILVSYCCITSDPKLHGSEQPLTVRLWFCRSELAWCDWVLWSGHHKGEIKVSAALTSHLEAVKRNLLLNTFLWPEFSSLQVQDWGPRSLAGCRLGSLSAPGVHLHHLSDVHLHLQSSKGALSPSWFWISNVLHIWPLDLDLKDSPDKVRPTWMVSLP